MLLQQFLYHADNIERRFKRYPVTIWAPVGSLILCVCGIYSWSTPIFVGLMYSFSKGVAKTDFLDFTALWIALTLAMLPIDVTAFMYVLCAPFGAFVLVTAWWWAPQHPVLRKIFS